MLCFWGVVFALVSVAFLMVGIMHQSYRPPSDPPKPNTLIVRGEEWDGTELSPEQEERHLAFVRKVLEERGISLPEWEPKRKDEDDRT